MIASHPCRRTRSALGAATFAILVAGCGSSGTPSGSTEGSTSRLVSRKGTCEIEVAALVDLNVAVAQSRSGAGASTLAPVLGAANSVLVAAQTVSAAVFRQGSTSGATKAITQECANRRYPVLGRAALAAVRKAVPSADVAVLEHVTITH